MMEYPHHSLYFAQATFSIPYKVLHRIPRMRSSLIFQRSYLSSLVILSLEALAKKASNIPFIHNFPSPVRLGIAWDTKGAIMSILFKTVFKVLGPMVYIDCRGW